MAPDAFHEFFLASAGAAGALVGLLFVAISVASEPVVGTDASVVQQTRASTALLAFVSPLVLALVALIPGSNIGYVAVIYGVTGLVFTAAAARRLLRAHRRESDRGHLWASVKTARQLAGLAAVMVLELWGGAHLIAAPHASASLDTVATAMIVSVAAGIDRAWAMVGGRQDSLRTHLGDLFAPADDHDPASLRASTRPARRDEDTTRPEPAPPPAVDS